MLKFNNISKSETKDSFLYTKKILNYLFTETLMVLLGLDHIQEKFHVLMDVYLYVILRFQKEELESKDNHIQLWINN
jgi:hypothetical protein